MRLFHAQAVSLKFVVVSIFFIFMALDRELVQAQGVHNLDTGESFYTISEAVDDSDTLNGHTISVDPGTYDEWVLVNKQLTIQSASGDPADTVVQSGISNIFALYGDGSTVSGFTLQCLDQVYASGVSVASSNCTVSNCIIQDGKYGIINMHSYNNEHLSFLDNTISRCQYDGIRMENSPGSTITGNTVRECAESISDCGIRVWESVGCTVSSNIIESNGGVGLLIDESPQAQVSDNVISDNGSTGLEIVLSSQTTMTNNAMSNNAYNFWLHSDIYLNPSYYMLDIDTTNTVDGKPIYYYKFANGIRVPADAGFVALYNCQNMTVRDLTLTGNGTNLLLVQTHDSLIENLDLSHAHHGIYSNTCNNNSFSGVRVSQCDDNMLYLYKSDYLIIDACEFIQNTGGGGLLFLECEHDTLSNSLIEDNSYGYISVSGTNNSIFEDILFQLNDRATIRIYNTSPSNVVRNNQFVQNDRCNISVWSSGYNYVGGNTVDQSDGLESSDGVIDLYQADHTQVRNNVVQNADKHGIYMEFCDDSHIEGNTITGIEHDAAIYLDHGVNNTIESNVLKENMYGMQVLYSVSGEFLYNIISDNWRGMMVSESGYNIIFGNSYLECSDIELMLEDACTNNFVHTNDFLAAVLRVYDVNSGNHWYAESPPRGNYWSTYKGVDMDGDGIGDTAIEVLPVGHGNFDNYPRMTPANLTLFTDKEAIQESVGGEINLTVEAGKGNAFRKYLVVGGTSGTEPGQALPGGLVTLPVNFDAFTYNIVFPFLNTTLFMDFLGTLNANGRAYPVINAPPAPGFAGVTMHYAFCCNNPFDFASNAIAVEIIP